MKLIVLALSLSTCLWADSKSKVTHLATVFLNEDVADCAEDVNNVKPKNEKRVVKQNEDWGLLHLKLKSEKMVKKVKALKCIDSVEKDGKQEVL